MEAINDCIDREGRCTGVACAEHDGATMRERAGRDFGPNKPNAGKAKGFNRVRGCAPVPSVRGHEIPDEVVGHRHFGALAGDVQLNREINNGLDG